MLKILSFDPKQPKQFVQKPIINDEDEKKAINLVKNSSLHTFSFNKIKPSIFNIPSSLEVKKDDGIVKTIKEIGNLVFGVNLKKENELLLILVCRTMKNIFEKHQGLSNSFEFFLFSAIIINFYLILSYLIYCRRNNFERIRRIYFKFYSFSFRL